MRELRRALWLLTLLLVLSLGSGTSGGCAPDQMLILVTVQGLGADASALQADVLFSGTASTQRFVVKDNLRQFALSLPNRDDQRGSLRIDVAALSAEGCKAGAGSVTVDTTSGEVSYDAEVVIQSPGGVQCTLSIAVAGGGTLNVSDGAKTQMCSGQCELDFVRGTLVTLSVAPMPQFLAETWSQECSGRLVSPCQLSMTMPRAAGAKFSQILCRDDKWCTYPSPMAEVTLRGVWGSGPSNVWAVGDRGLILHWDGINWSVASSGTVNDLHAVWGSGSSDIFAVGKSGTCLRWNGAQWKSINPSTTENLNSAWGASAGDVWAAGTKGTLYHFTNGTWSPGTVGTQNLNGVFGFAKNDIWAVGNSGTAFHYDGTTWSAKNTGLSTTINLNGVWGSASGNVLAVGDQDTVVHWSSSIWLPIPGPSGYNLRSIWGSSATNIWTVGSSAGSPEEGGLLFSDGGSWEEWPPAPAVPLRSIWGSSETEAWAVGDTGLIMRYAP